MADYERLIDPETRGFIRRSEELYAPGAAGDGIQERRRLYDAMCAAFAQPFPEGVSSRDMSADGVPVRVWSGGDPTRTVVYLHGGGFVLGGLDSHDDICAEICAGTGYRVVSVDYRLAPEHRHPAAFADAWAAACWAAAHFGDPLVLAGDSAGGNLAAAVAHHARGRLQDVLGQVLIYPVLGGDTDKGSYLEHADAPLLRRDDILHFNDIRSDKVTPAGDPTFEPLADDDFSRLPPTVIFTADCDPLRDDGRDYRDRLREAGGRVAWVNEDGLVHGYLRARGMSGRAADSFERIVLAIEALGQELWPYE
ncbi:MAG: alpha/beta hydrolase [Jhaorihella sp.]